VKRTLQSPTNQVQSQRRVEQTASGVDDALCSSSSPPSSLTSLYNLVKDHAWRPSTAAIARQFRADFAQNPDIKGIDLRQDDRDKTIRELIKLREATSTSTVAAAMPVGAWKQKFSMATQHLIKSQRPQIPGLLQEYNAASHRFRIDAYNARRSQRMRTVQEGPKMQGKQRQYDITYQEKQKKNGGGSNVRSNLPLSSHLGPLVIREEDTLQDVIERAKQYKHLYTKKPRFYAELEQYLQESRFNKRDIKTALGLEEREDHLEYVRAVGARKRAMKKQQAEQASTLQGHAHSTSPGDQHARLRLTKKQRISEMLATTDWHRTLHL
jgi:hypothetical protein